MQEKTKQWLNDFFILNAGTLLTAVGSYFFKFPNNFSTGGVTGISVVMTHYFPGLSNGTIVSVINIALLIVGLLLLGKGFGFKTFYVTVAFSAMLKILEVIWPMTQPLTDQPFMELLLGVFLPAWGSALLFNIGSSTGGTDIAGYLLQKKFPHYSIGHALMIIEGIILLMSIFVFQDVDAGLFGLISVYVQTKVIDMILYGSDAGSQAVIITQYPQEISQRVIQELERTTTVLPARGAYSGSPTNVVLCTVRKSEFVRLKRIIGQCDPNAFVMVNETTEVLGLGFKGFAEAI